MTFARTLALITVIALAVAIGSFSPATAAPGDQLFVNQSGYWDELGTFHSAPSNPITSALDAAPADSTVTVIEPGSYDMAVNFGGQNGIILDLGGARLDGTGFGVPGITIDGKSGITVKNGTIYRYSYGIFPTGTCSNLRFENLTIVQPSLSAIQLWGTIDGVTVDGVNIENPGEYGITKDGAGLLAALTITNSTVTEPGRNGINLEDTSAKEISDVLIDNVTVTGPTSYRGIFVQQVGHPSSTTLTVMNSTVTGVSHHAFEINSRGPIRFGNNTALDSATIPGTWGMYIRSPDTDSAMTFTDDNAIVHNGNGLYLANFRDLVLRPGTAIRENHGNPLQVDYCSNFTIRDTIFDDAAGSYLNGILVTGLTPGLTLSNITIVRPSSTAIRLEGTVSGVIIDRVAITGPGAYGLSKEGTGPLTSLTITNSTVTGPALNGINLEDTSAKEISNVLIDNVTVTGPTSYRGIFVQQVGQPSSTTLTVMNSTVSGVSHHAFEINSRGPIRFGNNTALDSATIPGTRGMHIRSPDPDSVMTFTDDNRIIHNGNGLYLANFRDLFLTPGTAIRENHGNPFQVDYCTNFTLRDTIIDDTAGSFTNGLYVTGVTSGFHLENVSVIRPSSSAILLEGTLDGVTVDRVTVTSPGAYGITKEGTGPLTDLTIANSTITRPALNGINLEDTSAKQISDILIDNVTVAGPASYRGILVQQAGHPDSRTVAILNSTVSGVSHHAFEINSRGPIRFENNTAQNSATIPGTYGCLLQGQGNPTLAYAGNTLRSNPKGQYLSSIRGNLNESLFQSTGASDDVHLIYNSLINTYNTTFDPQKTTVLDTSVLNVFWFLDIGVTDSLGNPMGDAPVTVTNATGIPVFSGTTGAGGKIPLLALRNYTMNSTGRYTDSPYLLHAEKTGVGLNDTYVDLDRSKSVTLVLRQVLEPPVADFTADPTTGDAPLTVMFNDTSTGTGIDGWGWVFGDNPGMVFPGQNLTHTFESPGTYNVNHSATNAAGTGWKNETGSITVNLPPPTADFTANLTSGVAPLAVMFNDTSTGTGIDGWSWVLGDNPGRVFPGQNLTHTFEAPGTYSVNHSATNAAGTDWKNETDYITVTAAPLPPPTVTAIKPAKHARGGKKFLVTITGSDYQYGTPGTAISLWRGTGRKINGTGVTVRSATSITGFFKIPKSEKTGPHNVTVTNPDGQKADFVNRFKVTK